MPFLAIPAIASAAIGAGGSLASSLLSRRGGGGAGVDPYTQQIEQKQLALSNTLSAGSATDLGSARSTLQLPLDYFTKILTGNRYDALQSLAPEVGTITSQYDAGIRSVNEFAPRGGGRSSMLEETKYHRMADVTNTLLRARPNAASNLITIGQIKGNMGTSEAQAAASALSGASSTDANAQRLALEREQMRNSQYSDIGSGIGSILATLIYARKGAASGGGPTPPAPGNIGV